MTLSELRRQCDAAAPDTEDFDSLIVSPALDASSAALSLLEYLNTSDLSRVGEVAALCCDSVDMYVQEIDGLNPGSKTLEADILKHPLMQRELKRQRDDLQRLGGLSLTREAIESVRAAWGRPEMSNLDLNASTLPEM